MFDNKRIYLILAGILSVFFTFYYLFQTDEKPNKQAKNKAAIGALLGSNSGNSGSSSSGSLVNTSSNDEGSIFDSDFMKPTGLEFKEDNRVVDKNAAKGEIPINPQTGKPYTVEQMEQFEDLKAEMPDNDLIPKRMTPEEKALKDEKTREIQAITVKVANNTANRNEVETYYGAQEKVLQDRLEIIEYLISGQEESGAEDKDGQFKKILDGTKEQIRSLEEQKKNALSRF